MEPENQSGQESSVPETTPPNKSPNSSRCCGDDERYRRCFSRRHRWIGALLVLGIVGFFAYSAYYGKGWGCSPWPDHGGYHQRFSSERAGDSAPRRLDWAVSRLLSEVDASEEQRIKIRKIADTALSDLQQISRQHRDSRRALLAILKAATIDRGKLESLRVESVRGLDDASRRLSAALGDLAEVLTPLQRQQLADSAERWHRN